MYLVFSSVCYIVLLRVSHNRHTASNYINFNITCHSISSNKFIEHENTKIDFVDTLLPHIIKHCIKDRVGFFVVNTSKYRCCKNMRCQLASFVVKINEYCEILSFTSQHANMFGICSTLYTGGTTRSLNIFLESKMTNNKYIINLKKL